MKPTAEQEQAIEGFKSGKRLRISAYAGTGKTSTLRQLSTASSRRGVYLAFNKSIADEARERFDSSVTCSTTHAMAFRAMKDRGYSVEKMTTRMNGGALALKTGAKGRAYFPNVEASARGHCSLVLETVARFCRSDAAELAWWHCPLPPVLEQLPETAAKEVRESIAQEARRIWARMMDRRDDLPMGHDGYLKAWALSRPVIPGDYIMLDEAQDTNGVVMELVRHQQAQLICVGDAQQAIYEWRGARNAMVELPAEVETRLSQSFRFGAPIADYASEILAVLGETVPLRGNPAKTSNIGAQPLPDAMLFRTNGRLLEAVMKAMDEDDRPFIVGGTRDVEAFLWGVDKLKAGKPVESPLELFGFKDWEEVRKASEEDEDLRRWVSLVDRFGTVPLRNALQRLPQSAKDATVTLCTGHKSKGMEWERVRLENDFLRNVVGENDEVTKQAMAKHQYDEELRLFYVAVTRAKGGVEIPHDLTAKIEKLQQIKAAQPAKAAA